MLLYLVFVFLFWRFMNRQGLIFSAIVLGILLLGGCTEQSAHRSYTNNVYGFSLDPPTGWQRIEGELPNVAVRFTPVNSSNVSLIVSVPFILSEGLALSTFADQIEENLSESGANYTIISRDWRPTPDAQAYEITYSVEQDGITEYVTQVALLRTRTVFLITFTAPSDLYNQSITGVDNSIESFR